MTQMVMAARSNHVGDSVPPVDTAALPRSVYKGYFENEHGEQAIFTYKRGDDHAMVYLGDNDWLPVRVVDGVAEGLILDPAEVAWLVACWNAATATS